MSKRESNPLRRLGQRHFFILRFKSESVKSYVIPMTGDSRIRSLPIFYLRSGVFSTAHSAFVMNSTSLFVSRRCSPSMVIDREISPSGSGTACS